MGTRGAWTGHPSWNWFTGPKLHMYKFWHFCPVCHDHSAKPLDYTSICASYKALKSQLIYCNEWLWGRQSQCLNSWKQAVYNSAIVQNVVVTCWNSHDRSSWFLYEYSQRMDGGCWIHYLLLSSQGHIVVFSEVNSNSSSKYNTCTSFFVICVINYMNSSDAVPAFFTLFIFV